MALDENKADLSRFVSDKLLAGAPVDKIVIVGGGLEQEDAVKCSIPKIDIRALKGFHEEADTRIIPHRVHSDAEFLVGLCQDTDVFYLLVSHLDKMSCKQLWMKAGTSKKPRCLPIHTIRELLKEKIPEVETILSFDAITGCHMVSCFAGHRKKASWKKFTEHHMLPRNLGNGDLDDLTMTSAEEFICRVYNVTDAESCNEASTRLFSRCRSPEALP